MRIQTAITLVTAIALAGCVSKPIVKPIANPQSINANQFDAVFKATVDTFREFEFRVDRKDHRFGKITSLPIIAPTVFEPWRPQGDRSLALQSTVNAERRIATVWLEPAGGLNDSTEYLLRVEVLIERQQYPTRRLTGATRGSDVFGTLTSTPVEMKKRGITDEYWRPVTRDPNLEQRLLAAIINKSKGKE